ncbi:CDP-glycerol glycerophosphotransferase family protein [Campylobacter devanensis]|uniref:CDP-glycerol glycerophosphotransferase family protein n=1 Tax=Campylobacter devanensis TaxID=3161138 RepID=UPI000A356238
MSLQKKINKLKREPKLFFKDMFLKRYIPLKNKVKSATPKKKYGYCKYAIVSAVYNVEKYLDDYFKSIINQRLDFKNNIHIILVDDGSIDNSANIIKKYQKKYPKNITYIYKENGGQASARNLGLKLLQEDLNLKDKFTWVTFTDPDDFLDRDYFYEVDEFLAKNRDDSISMIACNLIFYFEKHEAYKDTHPLKFKFQENITILPNSNLNKNIQLSAATAFINLNTIKNTKQIKPIFNEEIVNFEDAYFLNLILMQNLNQKSAFLKNAKYYYRKRGDGSSTLDNIEAAYKKQLIKNGYLLLLLLQNEELFQSIPLFTQQTILYDLIWFIKDNINKDNFSFYSNEEKEELIAILKQIYSKIDSKLILEFNLGGCWFFHKVGILNCFKDEYPPFQITYIENFNCAKRQILLYYFTPDDKDIYSIRIDGKEIYADYEKTTQYDFLTHVFVYQKRLWIHIPEDSKKLEVFINDHRARITFGGKQHQSLEIKQLESKFKFNPDSSWLLIDKDIAADDNAEHFYRYMMKNHPSQNIVFALRKDSKDWDRLEKEGFNLVDFGSYAFEAAFKSCSKILSSHIDGYLTEYFGKNTLDNKQFIFLQHGIIKDDLSNWLNNKQIDCFITAAQKEYESIADNFNHYKFSNKEVALTGFARHDSLLEKNKTNTKQILIMPTWRKALVGAMVNIYSSSQREHNKEFKDSEYFVKWNDVLNNNMLKNIYEKYNYKIIFNPHPNMIPYLNDFTIPDFVDIADTDASLQDLFANSSVMITDYSSVAFEMGYLKKPVIYYQFDKEEFFKNQWMKGYFDYKRDGFGPVVTTQEELLIELENLVKNNCQVGKPYKSNMENTFAFRDGKCCERIYQAILELDKPYESKITTEQIRQKAKDALEHECFYEASCRYRYILENSQTIDISDVEQYLYCALQSNNGYEASKFLLSIQDKAQFNTHIKIELIKGILSKNSNSKEEIEWVLDTLENMQIDSNDKLMLTWAKLRIYIYLEKREKIKEAINILKNEFNISKDEIDLELYLLRNNILAASTSGGGQIEFFV